MPDHVQPVELDPVLQRKLAALGQPGGRNPGSQGLGAAGNRAEIAVDEGQRLVDVDISDQRETGVGGNVKPLEEGRDVTQRRRFQVFH